MEIIIVDDNRALLRSLDILLSEKGYKVHSFSTPKDAIDYIGKCNNCSIIILDFIMPTMTGLEMLELLNEETKEKSRVILITGHAEMINEDDLLPFNIYGYLTKPIDFDQLQEFIKKCENNITQNQNNQKQEKQ